MLPFQKRNIFALLVFLASVNLSANGVGFWCDTDKYDCDRHSSGIAEKNAVSVPVSSPVPAPNSQGTGSGVGAAPGTGTDAGAAPGTDSGNQGPAPSPFLGDSDGTVDNPEVIDVPGEDGWNPIDPPELIDDSGKDGGNNSEPDSEDGRQFPVLPFVAIAAGGGFLISLFFLSSSPAGCERRGSGRGEESALEVEEPDVTP